MTLVHALTINEQKHSRLVYLGTTGLDRRIAFFDEGMVVFSVRAYNWGNRKRKFLAPDNQTVAEPF